MPIMFAGREGVGPQHTTEYVPTIGETTLSPHTDITILLDRSGSMSAIKGAMESGFDEFLSAHRETPTTRLSLIQFDATQPYDVVYLERPITDAPKLDLHPRGMTPLNDALCRTIDETGRRLRDKRTEDRPNRVLMLVMTDGLENASKKHTATDVKHRVNTQTGQYNWEFVYLGTNQDALLEAEKLGISRSKAVWFNVNRVDDTLKLLASNTANYAALSPTASAGVASITLDWSELQRKQAAGTDTTDDSIKQTTTNGTKSRG